jgi:hypothetical protein
MGETQNNSVPSVDSREIFRYTVCGESRFGDPLLIESRMRRAMMHGEDDYDAVWGNLSHESPSVMLDAMERMIPAIEVGFKVKALDETTGEGIPRWGLIDLLSQFIEFQSNVKKSTDENVNSELSSQGPSRPSLQATTNDTAASGGTATEPVESRQTS